jgi:hypothetical protein
MMEYSLSLSWIISIWYYLWTQQKARIRDEKNLFLSKFKQLLFAGFFSHFKFKTTNTLHQMERKMRAGILSDRLLRLLIHIGDEYKKVLLTMFLWISANTETWSLVYSFILLCLASQLLIKFNSTTKLNRVNKMKIFVHNII